MPAALLFPYRQHPGAPVASATAAFLRLGSPIASGSSSGTFFGINAANGYGGNLVDWQVNGSSIFKLSAAGAITGGAALSITATTTLGLLAGSTNPVTIGNNSSGATALLRCNNVAYTGSTGTQNGIESTLTFNPSTGTTVFSGLLLAITDTASGGSGAQYGIKITGTVNKSGGTGVFTGIFLNVVPTALNSTVPLFAMFQYNSVATIEMGGLSAGVHEAEIRFRTATPGSRIREQTTTNGGTNRLAIAAFGDRFAVTNATGGSFLFEAVSTGCVLYAGGNAYLTVTANTLTIADATNFVLNATTGTKIGTATTQKLGFYNATPIVRPAAYTQTFATASNTHAARTATTLTDNSGGTANTTVQALADGVTYANDVAAIRNNFADLTAAVNALIADLASTAQVVNCVVDDLQSLGLVG